MDSLQIAKRVCVSINGLHVLLTRYNRQDQHWWKLRETFVAEPGVAGKAEAPVAGKAGPHLQC